MRFTIDWTSLQWEGNLPFSLRFRGQFPSTSPPGGLIFEGRFTEGFLRYDFEGGGAYIWRGLYMEGLTFGILR